MTEDVLPIIYEDEHLVAVNKPAGLLVHRSMIDRHETRFALQMIRDQVGQHVFPVHRLDKPTSGVLLMAKSSEVARALASQFERHEVKKTYQAVVRGWCDDEGVIDHALKVQFDKMTDRKARQDKPPQPAVTHYQCLACSEMSFAIGRYPMARYSRVALFPVTGRKHQLRRHMKHIAHPIIGDPKYGKGEHNRFVAEHTGVSRLMLACTALSVVHPVSEHRLELLAPVADTFLKTCQALELILPDELNIA